MPTNPELCTCKSCPYFSPFPEPQCRVEQPTLFVIPGPDRSPQFVSVWPPVKDNQWCGKHPDFKEIRIKRLTQ